MDFRSWLLGERHKPATRLVCARDRIKRKRQRATTLQNGLVLLEAFAFFACEQVVGFFEQFWDACAMGRAREAFEQIEAIQFIGLVSGEPVVAVSEEVVAHFAVFEHVECEGEISQAKNPRDIDLAGCVFPVGKALFPCINPFPAEHAIHFVIQ